MKRKILCVCNGGNYRSVALAEALKGTYGCEAISSSSYWLSRETTLMLCRWADIIAPVDVRDCAHLPEPDLTYWKNCVMWDSEFTMKIRVFEIGKDIWGNTSHPDLVAMIHRMMKEWLPCVS